MFWCMSQIIIRIVTLLYALSHFPDKTHAHLQFLELIKGNNSNQRVDVMIQDGVSHELYSGPVSYAGPSCSEFTFQTKSFMPDGDITVLVAKGHHVPPELCRKYCLISHPLRYCVSANIHSTGACYLTGYELFPRDNTCHYRKLCQKGRACFRRFTGLGANVHSSLVSIPDDIMTSESEISDFCRLVCEKDPHCVGFDVTTGDRFCPMVVFREGKSSEFSLFQRRCTAPQ